MEIFDVLFNGKNCNGVKTAKGDIYVKMPARKQKNATMFESIKKDSNGWKYTIIKDFDFEDIFELWIRNDGRIACNANGSSETFVSKEPFNPDTPKFGKLNNIITELYKTVECIKAYEKRNIPASTLIKLRRIKLLSTLNLLGYSNIDDVEHELDDSKMSFALSRIGGQLQNYINIGTYVHVEGKEKDEEVIRLNFPEGMEREEFLEMIEPVKDEYSDDIDFSKEQEEKREQKRGILSDYCIDASKKMAQADWLLYTRITKEIARLLLELNADILEQNQKTKISNLSQLTGDELTNRILRLIDSKDFAKACEIEKEFLVREAQRLVDEAQYMFDEMGEQGGKTSVGKAIQDIIYEESEFINKSREVMPKTQEGVSIDD